MVSFATTLSRPDLVAVVAYVATLNGISKDPDVGEAQRSSSPALTGEAARGARLFTEAVRSFGRCSTCHEVGSFGIFSGGSYRASAGPCRALKALATPNVKTGMIDGESCRSWH